MPSEPPFISFAQNAEDVVLWRAFQDVPTGTYVEVGANHPTSSSITRAFYDRGWAGIEIEPVTEFAEAYRAARPRDTVVQAAVTDSGAETVTIHVVDGTGLSTLDDDIIERHTSTGWTAHDESVPARRLDDILDEHLPSDHEIHFMVIDVEGSEGAVLATLDLSRRRPWVLVVEATAPNSTETTHEAWEPGILASGYRFCLFDGLSRFYVAEEHGELHDRLAAPVNPLDDFVPLIVHELRQELESVHGELGRIRQEVARLETERTELTESLVRWRGSVLTHWAAAAAGGHGRSQGGGHEVAHLRSELDAHRATLSWRITAPLRTVQKRRLEGWR